MHINDKYFHFPPFLSISWEHVAALNLKESDLIVHLTQGDIITIPGLTATQLELIFQGHGAYLQNEILKKQPLEPKAPMEINKDSSIRFELGSIDGMSLQHNPDQADAPDLPPELLAKIKSVTKILAPEENALLPKPEPHCNCFHCQIAKAIHQTLEGELEHIEEEPLPIENEGEAVSEEDLKFEQWEVTQTGDKLFVVINKLDPVEKYNVYLGQPVGCTCGKPGCEHILVVLKS